MGLADSALCPALSAAGQCLTRGDECPEGDSEGFCDIRTTDFSVRKMGFVHKQKLLPQGGEGKLFVLNVPLKGNFDLPTSASFQNIPADQAGSAYPNPNLQSWERRPVGRFWKLLETPSGFAW